MESKDKKQAYPSGDLAVGREERGALNSFEESELFFKIRRRKNLRRKSQRASFYRFRLLIGRDSSLPLRSRFWLSRVCEREAKNSQKEGVKELSQISKRKETYSVGPSASCELKRRHTLHPFEERNFAISSCLQESCHLLKMKTC